MTPSAAFAAAAAERADRHLRHCRELTELGMDLARTVAARALNAHDPAQNPDPSGDPYAEQVSTAGFNESGLLFTRLARCVRQNMALETSIAAEYEASIRPPADPRRAKIRRAIREATEDHTGRADIRRRADDQLDTELALDPFARATLPDLLSTICEDLGFKLDYESLAKELAPEYFAWSIGNGTPPH